ncbi:glycosyltransferase [Limnohabitans sp. WS1]|uniref:glycosyltransferase n=1 Tax=Limnohabitans sp. WS1 TaxID=1100726 RepID=UPI000D332DF3|nr:glycosyltransferase [Limnohabitans sp. WS1]PUE17943.1 hypothetical protein B9Z48_10180 [Limnohabitans sp. WS1]
MKKNLSVLFVQCAPSQLDSSFYSELNERTKGRISLALMNDGDIRRTQLDPELGIVPKFPPLSEGYPIHHVPTERHGGLKKLIALIARLRPRMVVVQDQVWFSKISIALVCRVLRISVIMRSDKNELSSRSRVGWKRLVEAFLVKVLFDGIAPVSKLTASYYRWVDLKKIWWFPYPSSKSKFSRNDDYTDVRRNIRESLGIPMSHCVYLAVVKFVDRENPDGIIKAFHELSNWRTDASLLLIGAGPMEAQLKNMVENLEIKNVYFCGYVPYSTLQNYFWASDVFVHLAWVGPWEISPQDALVAHLGLVTSNCVGSGICHLEDELSRFIVNPDDPVAAARAMNEAGDANIDALFSRAWTSVTARFTSDELAVWWANKLVAEGVFS